MGLADRKCVPCEGGVPPMPAEKADEMLPQVPGWRREGGRLARTLTFANFVEAMRFVNRMADVAEAEGHHPDFCVHYSRVELTVWTHAIGGLSENDFILAAKINALLAAAE